MLAADKLQLQSALKQQATALKEKEFSLHHNNLMTVGTQAAVLAGLDITMFIEFQPPPDSDWENPTIARALKLIYYGVIVAAFCANMTVVSHTTALSVLGGGLALRGPDGSMMTATDALYVERKSVFSAFAVGLACTVCSVLACVWILLSWEAALVCWIVTLFTCRTIYRNYHRARTMLEYDEDETVDFRDIMEGPAAIQAIPTRVRYRGGGVGSSKQKMYKSQRSTGGSSISSGQQRYGDDDEYLYEGQGTSGEEAYDSYEDVEMQKRGLLGGNSKRRDVTKRRQQSRNKSVEPIQTV